MQEAAFHMGRKEKRERRERGHTEVLKLIKSGRKRPYRMMTYFFLSIPGLELKEVSLKIKKERKNQQQ